MPSVVAKGGKALSGSTGPAAIGVPRRSNSKGRSRRSVFPVALGVSAFLTVTVLLSPALRSHLRRLRSSESASDGESPGSGESRKGDDSASRGSHAGPSAPRGNLLNASPDSYARSTSTQLHSSKSSSSSSSPSTSIPPSLAGSPSDPTPAYLRLLAKDESPCVNITGHRCSDEEIRQGPPPRSMDEPVLSAADVALFDRVRRLYPDGRPKGNGQEEEDRVAFLFLTRGPMPLSRLWERYLRGHERRYSIYVHAAPGFQYPLDSSPVFFAREVASEKVQWGDPSMVAAERRLLANALLDPANKRFIMVSESACDNNWNCMGHYSSHMQPWVQQQQWSKGSQWWALTWHHAFLAVTDRTVYPTLARWCKGDNWHRHCYLDEHYFQTLLKIRDPDHVARRGPTWAAWAGGAHPVEYGGEQLTPQFLRSIKWDAKCDWGGQKESCFLVLRKIAPSALGTLLDYTPEELGY
ncbi:hypothetical protein CLOM_g22807 [Closterium sp. NIES-68]|nr:hypothetical protein CLOM_g22807 [Closterium sp. NIES-68]GJP71270.1 hypothetical protein CLOP_g2119 [Closterium sp. NIES-67]